MSWKESEEQFAAQMRTAIQAAEVISVFFVQVGHSLIIDLRQDIGDPPAVFLDSMVRSPQERLLSFRRLRPNLPLPESITLAPWLDRVGDFNKEGLTWAMMERCRDAGGDRLASEVETCYRELAQLQRDTDRALIFGGGMMTVWQRPASDSNR